MNEKRPLLVGANLFDMRASPVHLDALWQVVELRRQIDLQAVRLVDELRADGTSWGDIGGALGVSAQAAHKRFSA